MSIILRKSAVPSKASSAIPVVDSSAALPGIPQILELLSEHFNQMGGQSTSTTQSASGSKSQQATPPRPQSPSHPPIPVKRKSSIILGARRCIPGSASLRQRVNCEVARDKSGSGESSSVEYFTHAAADYWVKGA